MSIYVETRIRGSIDELWRRTQTPELHNRWDLRFTEIEYLPRPDPAEPQQFLYATRIGFGLSIRGCGESVGQRDGADGQRTSALEFWSDDPRSLIREGAGYWRYVPTDDGARFFTAYDYRVRFGVVGRVFDALLFRPLIGWATAWSFDRLRLWIEAGIEPETSRQLAVIHLLARLGLSFGWLYQGIVPKLLAQHTDELTLLAEAGVRTAVAPLALQALGWCEALFGLLFVLAFHQRWHFWLTIALMFAALAESALNSPRFLLAAFNPASLNGLMIVLAVIGLLASKQLPSARRSLRKPAKEPA